MDWVKTTTRWDEKHLSFEIWCDKRFYGTTCISTLLLQLWCDNWWQPETLVDWGQCLPVSYVNHVSWPCHEVQPDFWCHQHRHSIRRRTRVSQGHVYGLVQEKRNSIDNALELHLSCTHSSILCVELFLRKHENIFVFSIIIIYFSTSRWHR